MLQVVSQHAARVSSSGNYWGMSWIWGLKVEGGCVMLYWKLADGGEVGMCMDDMRVLDKL